MDYLIGKIIEFPMGTGCIPPKARCYCFAVNGENLCVVFSKPILGSCELKLHIDVVKKHGFILDRR